MTDGETPCLTPSLLAAAYQRAGQPEKAAQTQRRAEQQTVGRPAPDFTFQDTTGHAVHLADLRGKPVLLYFWYYPSAPSRAVAPQIESLKQQYRDQGLTVVSLVPGASHEAIDFAGKTFTYPLLLNAAPAFTSYRISSQFLPTLVLIGPDGKIAARHSGPSPGIEATLEREAAKLLPATAAAP